MYFKGADFSDVQDLQGLYHDLNTTNWRDKLDHGKALTQPSFKALLLLWWRPLGKFEVWE